MKKGRNLQLFRPFLLCFSLFRKDVQVIGVNTASALYFLFICVNRPRHINITCALQQGVDAYMGVTKFVDDEKPLFVETDESMRVLGFHDEDSVRYKYVSAGIYGLHPHIFDILQRCIQRGEQRMRNFQRALIAAQCTVMAHDMGQVLDIDHLSDVAKAEAFLRKSTSQTKDKYQELDR